MLNPATLPAIQAALAAAGLDGWLLFDFRGINPVAAGLLQLDGLVTRRVFAYLPRRGVPTAITHAIEQGPWHRWPAAWNRVTYSAWPELERALASLVRGQRVAMEYSPGDAVPYLDRVPAGVLEMVRTAGADVVTSGELTSRFYAVWEPDHRAAHSRAAATISAIAREAIQLAGARTSAGEGITEYAVQTWILERFARAGLETVDAPTVAVGPNAANPHYAPTASQTSPIVRGDVLLIDLWAREPGQPFADQAWVGVLGAPDDQTTRVWNAVRDARDAAIALLRTETAAGHSLRGRTSTVRHAASLRPAGTARSSRTGRVIPSTPATFTDRARTSTIWSRARSGCSFPALPSRSSPECTSPASWAFGAR